MSESKKNYAAEARQIGDRLKNARRHKKESEIRKALKDSEILRQLVKTKGSKEDKFNFFLWARKLNIINRDEEYELNKFEADKAEDECEYVQKINGGIGAYLELNDKVKYTKYYSQEKGEDIFTFYVVVEKEPEDIITSKSVARKFIRDGFLEDKDRPESYEQVHRFELKESEFIKYFNVVE